MTENSKKAVKLSAFLLLVMSLIFGTVSIFMKLRSNNLTKSCTETISATIIDIQETRTKDYEGYYRTTYYNVYQYKYGQITYNKKSNTNKHDNYNIGDKVTIKVDPNNPSEFIDANTTSTLNILFIAFIIASSIMFIVSIILFIIYIKNKHVYVYDQY